MNSTNAFSKRFNYENEALNNTCLFTLQNKLQNIAIAKIESLNKNSNEKNINFEKHNKNSFNFLLNEKKKHFFKQTFRRINAKKAFANNSMYSDFNKKFLNKIKNI